MNESAQRWHNTTHDWASTVDSQHLAQIRRWPGKFAPGGVLHLIIEVIAYAADEAECTGSGRCTVTLHADRSVTVADNGRGTDTRHGQDGNAIKKPVMSTKDLRFFDSPKEQILPDGYPRRGMSVVAALSEWLVHTNRRRNGSWTQCYEHGSPVTDLIPTDDDTTTGTTIRFFPAAVLRTTRPVSASVLFRLANCWPYLTTEIVEERG